MSTVRYEYRKQGSVQPEFFKLPYEGSSPQKCLGNKTFIPIFLDAPPNSTVYNCLYFLCVVVWAPFPGTSWFEVLWEHWSGWLICHCITVSEKNWKTQKSDILIWYNSTWKSEMMCVPIFKLLWNFLNWVQLRFWEESFISYYNQIENPWSILRFATLRSAGCISLNLNSFFFISWQVGAYKEISF